MTRYMRLLVAVVVGSALVGGVAGAAVPEKAKKVDTAKYAKVVCVNYLGATGAVNDFIDSYNNDTSDDAATFQTEVVQLGTDLGDQLAGFETKLKKVYPDIDNGKKVSKTFVQGLQSVRTEIEDAVATFQAADPNGVAFAADISTFEVTINLLDVKRDDPFGSVDDQGLLGAFKDEKSCKNVVTIFGG